MNQKGSFYFKVFELSFKIVYLNNKSIQNITFLIDIFLELKIFFHFKLECTNIVFETKKKVSLDEIILHIMRLD